MSKMKLASVVVAMLLFFAAVSGTGYALADDSLPGEPLYGLKGAFEQARANLTRDPQAKAELAIDLAQLRLEEVAQMLEKGQTVDQKTADETQIQLREAKRTMERAMESIEEPSGQALQLRFQNMFRHALQRMGSFIEDHPSEEAGAMPQLVRFMSRTATQYQYQAGTGDEATSGAQTQTQQGPSGSQGSTDAPGTGSQLNAQDGLGPYQPWDSDTPWGHYDDEEDNIGQHGPGQDGVKQPGLLGDQEEENPAFGPGPGQPPDDAPLGPNPDPSGSGLGDQSKGPQNGSGGTNGGSDNSGGTNGGGDSSGGTNGGGGH